MSSRLTKHPYHHHDDRTVISADSDDGTTDRVIYLSKNTRDGRQFEAVSPPNSVHAKKLAELAMLVQSNQRQSGRHRRPVPALAMSGKSVAQIAPVAYQTPAPQTQQIPYATGPREVYESGPPQRPVSMGGDPISSSPQTQSPSVSYVSAASCCPHQNSQTNAGEQQQYQQSVSQSHQYTVSPPQDPEAYISELQPGTIRPDPQYQPPEVHRYTTEQQTGYKVKTRTGELKVSAPVGSSEARAFDGVVEKMSSKEEHRHDKERRLRRRSTHREQEKKGSGWFWR